MNFSFVESSDAVTLIAGGICHFCDLAIAYRHAPCLVAADGGARHAMAYGVQPTAIMGDFDSLNPAVRRHFPNHIFHHINEQETTDFDKALRHIHAPFVLAVGALGGRVDHQLAAFYSLMRHQSRGGTPCLIIGECDIIFAAPPRLLLDLCVGDRVSLFPMASVRGGSRGLHWPIDGIEFSPMTAIGTSNKADAPRVELCFDTAGMLVILPRARLQAALRGLELI